MAAFESPNADAGSCWPQRNTMGFAKQGVPFSGSPEIRLQILGSILGSAYFGKLPYA